MEEWGDAVTLGDGDDARVATAADTIARLSMSTLAQLPAAIERNPSKDVRIGVVHIGPGAFHRAHQAWYFDEVLNTDPNWGICAVALKSTGVRDALQPQDGLYTVAVLDDAVHYRVISALRELLVAPHDRERVLTRMAASDTAIVTLTITEKGYCLRGDGHLDFDHIDIAHDLAHPRAPDSAIGYLVEALRRRRADGLAPFTTISCDNLVDNGHRLRQAVMALAAQNDAELAAWIETQACFPRSMVDSIVPATDDALRARVAAELGVEDRWPVQREAFKQWVIEDLFCNRRPDLVAVGATLTDDVPGFVQAKLRLLNGAHSALAYIGFNAGHRHVAEAMADPALAAFVRALMIDDILPSLKAPPGLDLPAYIDAILQRFRNPAMRHALAQIAWDGTQKLPFRWFGTVTDALAGGREVSRFCVAIAAWLHFLRDAAAAGRPLIDPLADAIQTIAQHCDGSEADVARWLQLDGVFPVALTGSEVFVAALKQAYVQCAD